MSASSASAFGRWFWGVALLGCTAGFGALAWRNGSLDPIAWWIGTPGGDPAYSTPDAEKYVEPELSPELMEAQFEPSDEDETVADSGTASSPDAEAADEDRLEPSPRREFRERKSISASERPGKARVTSASTSGADDEIWFREAPRRDRNGKPGRAAPVSFEEEVDAGSPRNERIAASEKPAPPIDGEGRASRAAPLMDLRKIDALENDGDLIAAQHELSRRYWQKPAERETLLPRLNRMARALYFAPQPHYYEPYVVEAGDQLRLVGQSHKLSWEYLTRLNQTDARKIRAGQKLKIVPGPFSAQISLSRYELVVHLAGSFVKNYRVGVGKDGTTPLGTFTVRNKMVDPTYYGPEGVIAHDDPRNPLGERWIDIGDGYGIHGTIEPASIGRNESRGCIRLLNSDVEEVYDFLVVGSEVKIER